MKKRGVGKKKKDMKKSYSCVQLIQAHHYYIESTVSQCQLTAIWKNKVSKTFQHGLCKQRTVDFSVQHDHTFQKGNPDAEQ